MQHRGGAWDRLGRRLRELRPSDAAGAAGAVIGAVLVASGSALEGQGVATGTAVRTLGGVLLLAGLAVVLLGEPRRRAASADAARRLVARYMAATGHWRWPNRVGVAAMVVGLLLLAPALVAQVLFGTVFGAMIVAPGIVVFWGGVALIVYARFRRGDDPAARRRRPGGGRRPR